MLELSNYVTEMRNPDTMNLDQMSSLEIAEAANREDAKVAEAVKAVLPQVAEAIDASAAAIKNGGRLLYIGAGTSGRLGVLDSSECPPTFGMPEGTVLGLIAGGEEALFRAAEGAEDNTEMAEMMLRNAGLCGKDMVIGLSASGRTPFVVSGLRYAGRLGCRTAAVACNKSSRIGEIADIVIEPVTGPELLTGSTRLKAGTAQKMILNMISTGCMVKLGKVYENLMIDLQCTNEKLNTRAESIVASAAKCSRDAAAQALKQSGGEVKLAVVMLLTGKSAKEAAEELAAADGKINQIKGCGR